MPVNVSGLVNSMLNNGMLLKEVVSSSHKLERASKNKVDFRLVIDLLAGMGLRIILDGDRFKTAHILSGVHSNVPPHLSDGSPSEFPYAVRRQSGKYMLLPAFAENHIPVKIEAWLKVSASTWFPVILYRDMVNVPMLSEAAKWCSRFYSTANIPVIDLNEATPSIRLLRVSSPVAAEIYALQSVTFTLTNKGKAKNQDNRYAIESVETEDTDNTRELVASFSETFPLLQEAFQHKADLNVGDAVRMRKLIHYASDSYLSGVQDHMLATGWRA